MTESEITAAITNTMTPFVDRLERKIDESDDRSSVRVAGLNTKIDTLHAETQDSLTQVKISGARLEERFEAHERTEVVSQADFKKQIRSAISESANDRRWIMKALAGGSVGGGVLLAIAKLFGAKGPQ